jgi:hypothetical protein
MSTVFVALLWPYFPLLDLIVSQGDIFHGSNLPMYQGVLQGAGLALLALPFIALRLKADWRDPLSLMFLGLLGIYAYGGLSGKWSYGRVMPSMVMIAHMVLAKEAADWELKSLTSTLRRRVVPWLVPLGMVSACLLIYFNAFGLGSMVGKRWFPPQRDTYEQYRFLSRFTGQYDVILSDLETGWPVPSFGGKIVATWHPLAFVSDHRKRQEDVDTFFGTSTSQSDRKRILQSYRVNYILVGKRKIPDWQKLVSSLKSLGTTAHEDDAFVLIAVKPDARG